jgi:hypothetical protein
MTPGFKFRICSPAGKEIRIKIKSKIKIKRELQVAGDFYYDGAGDFIVPGLFVAVPAGPEAAEENAEGGDDAHETADGGDHEVDGTAIGADDFMAHHEAADASASPGPHGGEVSDGAGDE